MKLLKYILISILVLGIALIAPAMTQPIPTHLPLNLSAALCINNWDRALALVQQMLNSPDVSSSDRTQLVALSAQIRHYQQYGGPVDQSDACASAISPGQSHVATNRSPGFNCAATHLTVDGRCFANQTAARRYSRSIEEGDRAYGDVD
ncbi:MAG TPA: hypothetical protein V6C78_21895 [Crinalium sp.]|jgi:hypothetical protein